MSTVFMHLVTSAIHLILDVQILDHPKSIVSDHHTQVSLSVSAIGPGPLAYKWKKDGVDIIDQESHCTGASKPTITISSLQCNHEGNYMCEIKYNQKSVRSNSAKIELSKKTTVIVKKSTRTSLSL